MAKQRWSAAQLDERDEEMPSLTHSDRSSERSPSLYDECDDDHSCSSGFSDHYDEQGDKDPAGRRVSDIDTSARPGRSATKAAIDRSARSGRAAIDRSSRSAVGAVSPPPSSSRARSSSRPRRRPRKPQALRFSYARRASLNGTTVYPATHMATLDTYLRSTSGLRLQTDGTCTFLFEGQQFVIEATGEEGKEDSTLGGSDDFLFYASFGSLRDLQRKNGYRPKYLLRLLATWNEELKRRNEGGEDTGLLRIDSNQSDGPHVAFIYYGHLDEIRSSTHFQEALDDFVDDALEFSEKLHGFQKGEEGEGEAINEDKPKLNRDDSHINASVHHSSFHGSFHGSFNNSSNANVNRQAPRKEEPDAAITSTDIFHAHSKKSVFSKMIDTLRSRQSGGDISSHAFIDPNGSSACAFVVDKNAPVKPTIKFTREGGEEPTPVPAEKNSGRRGSSFHGKGRSFQAGDDSNTRSRAPTKSTSFRDDHDPRCPRHVARHSASFHEGHGGSFHASGKASRGRSFHAGSRRHSSYAPEEGEYGASTQSMDTRSRRSSSKPRRRPTKRHSTYDEGRDAGGRSGGGYRGHGSSHNSSSSGRGMNASEPVLGHGRARSDLW